MTTLQDIADHLQLSRATVSRALNGYPEINLRTRQRVQEAASQLNYKPNLNARQLATGRSGLVAMMMLLEHNEVKDLSQLEFMSGLSLAIEKGGLDMMFHVVNSMDDLDTYQRFLNRGSVDGMILNSPCNDDPRVPLLQAHQMPFVMHGRAEGEVAYAYYDIDNHAVFARATRLLLDMGHRRMLYINGPQRMAYARQRERGLLDTLKQRCLSLDGIVHCFAEQTDEAGYQYALQTLQAEGQRVTACMCSSTLQAVGVYRAAAKLGLQIGRDLSVIAHDDDLPHWRAEHFTPALTVTRSPIRDACEPLARMMIALIAGAEPTSLQSTVKPELIVRDSTGPAP